MGNPFKDGWAKFDAKGLEKLEAEVAKMRDPIRKLSPKDPPDARWKALSKAAGVADIDRRAAALGKRQTAAEELEKIEEPSFPSTLSRVLTLIVDTAKSEMKSVGKAGPFPKTQAAIDAAVAAHRAEAKLLPAAREEARKVWSALQNEQRNDATFIEGHAEALQKFTDQLVKDAAKIKAITADKHQKAIAALKKAASDLILAMDSAAKYVGKAVDDYDVMEAGIVESADNMEKPSFMAVLVKDFAP